MDTDGRFPTPTTRRTIVATGAKLAYAAPLVATSLTLSATNAAAAMSPPRFVCTQPVGLCLDVGPDSDCFCAAVVPSGAFVCATDLCGSPFCDDATGAGCPAGMLCVVDGFLEGRAHCHVLCGEGCPSFPSDSTRAGAPAHS